MISLELNYFAAEETEHLLLNFTYMQMYPNI